MKKFLLTVALFSSALFFSQSWSGVGDNKLQIGLNGYGNGGQGIKFTYDLGITNLFSLGAGADFYVTGRNESAAKFFLYGRGNLHLNELINLPKEFDIYPGISIGVLGNTLGVGGHLGIRYFFNNKLGAFVELGNRGALGLSINI